MLHFDGSKQDSTFVGPDVRVLVYGAAIFFWYQSVLINTLSDFIIYLYASCRMDRMCVTL